jgi:hypothetical protein
MDVLNFISWLKSKRQVTTVNASQTLIPIGLKDARRGDGYLPGAISVEDLAGALTPTFTQGNIKFGDLALANLTSGSENIAIGTRSLEDNVSSSFNIAIGTESSQNIAGGGNNVGVGPFTLRSNTGGSANVAIGMYALFNNTTGSTNVAVGQGALYNNTVYDQSVAIGHNALENNNKAGNTAVGYCALRMNQGWRNIAVGNSGIDSGFAAASDNISIGNQAFQSLTTGEFNIGIGTSVMNSCNTGSNNTVIGAYSTSLNFSNTVVIGRDAVPTVDNQLVIGSNTYNVGAIATEALTPTISWAVRINGVNYKIPLQIA